MAQTQLSIPLSEEKFADLTSKAADYGMTAPLFGAKVLEAVLDNEEIMKTLQTQISSSSLNELIELTITRAKTAEFGTTFRVNSFIEESRWADLSINEKRSVAMALARETRNNPRYAVLKAGGVNVYSVVTKEEGKESE